MTQAGEAFRPHLDAMPDHLHGGIAVSQLIDPDTCTVALAFQQSPAHGSSRP